MTPPAPVRLGVLGCGWIAGNRLRQIAEHDIADVVMVADTDLAAVDRIRQWAPEARRVSGPDAFDPTGVDAVMVSTPSALHCGQALTLLDRGLPVFVQKPVGLSASEVADVLEAAARAGVPMSTDLCYRHLQSARVVREALDLSRIGQPFLVEGCFHNAYRPGSGWAHDIRLAGGGALMDLGIHLTDLVMWLTGHPLSLDDAWLRCGGRPWKEGEVENFAVLNLRSADGVAVRLTSCWDASTGLDAEIRLRVYGQRGTLEIANRSGSFYDFDARLCQGTTVQPLAADDGDEWQAGPLLAWLAQVAAGSGYVEPDWVRESVALIDAAYSLEGTRKVEPTAARGNVHVLGKKGVLP